MTALKKSSLDPVRRKAERIVKKNPLTLPYSDAGKQTIIHELHVHQIELQIQNEELLATQHNLERARNKYSNLFNNAPVGYLILDRVGFVVEANRTFAEMAGYRPNEIKGKPFGEFLTEQAKHLFNSQFRSFFKSPDTKRMDLQLGKDGRHRCQVSVYGNREIHQAEQDDSPAEHGGQILIAVMDISEQRMAEEAMRRSLAEKEVLLKEIHHRVKNNMQVVSSLVDLQAEDVENEAVHDIFKDVTYRIRSMAMVHEKLYQSADFSRVEFANYTESLLSYLWHALGAAQPGIEMKLDLEPVLLPVTEAIPCGLILNELFTNALKHAFTGRDHGAVSVSLRIDRNKQIILSVQDDGVGLPAEIRLETTRSLGLRLVNMLSRQLRGSVTLQNDKGTTFTVMFEVPEV